MVGNYSNLINLGGGNKAFSPFTVTASQAGQAQPPTGTASAFAFGAGGQGSGYNLGGGPVPASASASAPQLSIATPSSSATSLLNFGGLTPASSSQSLISLPGSNPAPVFPGLPPVPVSNPGIASSQPTLPTFGLPNVSSATIAQPSASLLTQPISFGSTPQATVTAAPQPTFGVVSGVLSTSSSTSTLASAVPSLSSFALGPGVASTGLNIARPVPTSATTTAAPSTTTAATQSTETPTASASSSATSVQAVPPTVSQMNFRQLQEVVNKWMLDLQDQERLFLEQATKVNGRDVTLIVNGDKIGRLNETITKVKADHARLDYALEYLTNQQQEFEAFLEPLEAGVPSTLTVEPEREHLYTLTEKVDNQLQQMSEDLKEVIRHINEANKFVDKNDPVSQILRILNEHTDALQWVEDSANRVKRSLDNVSQQHQKAKKEHERSIKTIFN